MPKPYEHDYPPADWTAGGIADALRSAPERFPIPSYDDEDAWAALRADGATGRLAAAAVEEAERVLETPIPPYPASLYLEYSRGENVSQRAVMEPSLDRVRRLSAAVLAECLERDGRFEDAVLDHVWALCEQTTWLHPANLSEAEDLDGLPTDAPAEERNVALRPAGFAKLLAQVDHVLGDRLHPAARRRIRSEVEHRVLEPYEARDDMWWMEGPASNNWNAVCNAGAAVAALYLVEDADRQGRLLAKAARNLRYFLAAFDSSGSTPEGVGYWNYGFGNYAQLALHLERRTDGAYSLLSPPVVREIAQFPLRTELSPGRYPPFSDAAERTAIDPFVACWLGHRLDRPGLAARGRAALEEVSVDQLPETLLNLIWGERTPADWTVPTPPKRTFLAGNDWWIARADPADPDGLVVAAKGGHNGESHNHNDCGSFVAHVDRESLLTDLGSPVYDDEFFGDRRYEFLAARSLGHSVPCVNGYEQAAGVEHAARVLDRTERESADSLALDLAGCYPAGAGLDALRRTLTLDREGATPTLTVEDRATFADDAPGTDLTSVVVSYADVDADGDALRVAGDRAAATIRPDCEDASVERLDGAIDKSETDWMAADFPDVRRVRLRATTEADGDQATVRYVVSPDR